MLLSEVMLDGVVGIVQVIEGQFEAFEEVVLEIEELFVDVVGVLLQFVERIQQVILLVRLLLVLLHD